MCHHPYIPAWDTDFYCVWGATWKKQKT
jgi:hypothetical protein